MNLNVNIVVKYLKGLQMLGELFGSVLGVKKKQAEYFRQAISPSTATVQRTDMEQQRILEKAKQQTQYTAMSQRSYQEQMMNQFKQKCYFEAEFYFREKFRAMITELEHRINELETELAIERELSTNLVNARQAEIEAERRYFDELNN